MSTEVFPEQPPLECKIGKEHTIHLPDGWLSAEEAHALNQLAKGRRVLELGAFKGRSTVAMALTAKHVVSVDWHGGDKHVKIGPSLEDYKKNIEPYKNIIPIVGRFEQVVPLLEACKFEMIFVDGQHDYPSVIRDMYFALGFEPQVIAFHDWGKFQVTQGLSAFGIKPTSIVDTLAIFDATKAPIKVEVPDVS